MTWNDKASQIMTRKNTIQKMTRNKWNEFSFYLYNAGNFVSLHPHNSHQHCSKEELKHTNCVPMTQKDKKYMERKIDVRYIYIYMCVCVLHCFYVHYPQLHVRMFCLHILFVNNWSQKRQHWKPLFEGSKPYAKDLNNRLLLHNWKSPLQMIRQIVHLA